MKNPRPQAVMMSKRSNVFYLEHVRLMQYDNKVVYRTEKTPDFHQYIAIPDKNTAFILLGRGTSITDLAMRMLSESNVLVGFCGSGGSPLFGLTDITFLNPQDEYRPPLHAQAWFGLWSVDSNRLEMGKELLLFRQEWAQKIFKRMGFHLDTHIFDDFQQRINNSLKISDLLLAEAGYVKQLYMAFAKLYGLQGFTRDTESVSKKDASFKRINDLLSHGNYLAYGYAAVSLHTMGIPYFLPILHGKTRRGALVFDIADLCKDWLVIPAAFEAGVSKHEDRVFRAMVIETAMKYELLDYLMGFISELPGKILIKQQLTKIV